MNACGRERVGVREKEISKAQDFRKKVSDSAEII